MSKLATFWTGDLSEGFPSLSNAACLHDGRATRKGMLKNIEGALSAKWGGVTVTRVRGVWWENETTCAKEFGYKFEVYFHPNGQHVQDMDVDGDWVLALKQDARYIASVLKQKEVHVTVTDVEFFSVRPPSAFVGHGEDG